MDPCPCSSQDEEGDACPCICHEPGDLQPAHETYCEDEVQGLGPDLQATSPYPLSQVKGCVQAVEPRAPAEPAGKQTVEALEGLSRGLAGAPVGEEQPALLRRLAVDSARPQPLPADDQAAGDLAGQLLLPADERPP